MTSPSPGWYPDPGGAAPLRWWNGQAWTTATSDGAAPAAAQPATPAVPAAAQSTPGYELGQTGYAPSAQFGAATGQFGATETAVSPAGTPEARPTTAYGTASPFGASGTPASNYSTVVSSQEAKGTSLWHQNQAAFGTFILTAVAVMLVLAFTSPILIFTPIAAASAANQSRVRGEPLAPLAMGAAAITIVLAVVALTRIL